MPETDQRHPAFDDGPEPHEALRHLRRFRSAVLQTDAAFYPVTFVAAQGSGELLMVVPPRALDSGQHVLHVPEERDDAMQLLLTLRPGGDDPGFDADRHSAYHGAERAGLWAWASVDSGKWSGMVYDGRAFEAANTLRDDEPALVRQANADRDALRGLCARRTGTGPAEPVCVGIDPDGLDVRARFGIVRVEFDAPAADGSAARATLAAMLGSGEPTR